ncbi:MAG: (2Fe-2S)-binding protein [Parachlamydiaceae bacterium]|nr:(2Fe-2S)-binding protein [Parachlamydiaceae bacterium]
MATLYCLKQDKNHFIKVGTELLRAYQIDPTIPLKFGCCEGKCGVCVIKVVKGEENLSKRTRQENETLEIKNFDPTYRLACQCAILGDVTIDV